MVGLGDPKPKSKHFPLWLASNQDTYQSFNYFGGGFHFWDLIQKYGGHRFQGLCWPLVKPVDGTAVDQGGELPQASSEDLSNGAGRLGVQ